MAIQAIISNQVFLTEQCDGCVPGTPCENKVFFTDKEATKKHIKESINLILDACMYAGFEIDEIIDECIIENVPDVPEQG